MLLPAILLVIGTAIAGGLLVVGPDPSYARSRANLRRGFEIRGVDRPDRSKLRELSSRFLDTPERRGRYARLIARAGHPDTWTVDRVLSAKVLLALVATAVLGVLLLNSASPMLIGMMVGVIALAFFLPDILLYNTAVKRREQIELMLPDLLDQMSIAVQAGLAFDAAMVHTARQNGTILGQELMRTVKDIQVGRTRRDAYEDLIDRSGSPQLRRFVRAVLQADTYGVPLGTVLHTQAGEMRRIRRQRAERKAMQVPTLVIFPLMLCILPALFIVILGPAAINIASMFGALGG
ncbi:MAG: type II secretion system F family protein [Propionibacteriaceae bacterium]|nr:type II secretion system F family protein [Propionibacteriaceae bacterium]